MDDEINENLLVAVIESRLLTVKSLSRRGANPNFVDDNGLAALHHAVKKKDLDIVKVLLEGGADPNTTMLYQKHSVGTALHIAVRNGDLDMVKELLWYGADPNALDRSGETPLFEAIRSGYWEIIQELLDSGVNLYIARTVGGTALFCALYNRKVSIVKILQDYTPSLRILSLRSIRRHRINVTKIPGELF